MSSAPDPGPATTAGGGGRGDRFEEVLETDHGPARLVTDPAVGVPVATLLLSHGAGGGIGARDLVALAQALPSRGVAVVRLEQPWRVAGRRIATAPPTLDSTLRLAAEGLAGLATPLVLGGRSAGARSACRTAREVDAAGVLALAFPLHPPGRPERSRRAELSGSGVPTLLIQGERDSMGRPDEFGQDGLDHVEMVVVADADHSMKVSASSDQAEALGAVVGATLDWLGRQVGRRDR